VVVVVGGVLIAFCTAVGIIGLVYIKATDGTACQSMTTDPALYRLALSNVVVWWLVAVTPSSCGLAFGLVVLLITIACQVKQRGRH